MTGVVAGMLFCRVIFLPTFNTVVTPSKKTVIDVMTSKWRFYIYKWSGIPPSGPLYTILLKWSFDNTNSWYFANTAWNLLTSSMPHSGRGTLSLSCKSFAHLSRIYRPLRVLFNWGCSSWRAITVTMTRAQHNSTWFLLKIILLLLSNIFEISPIGRILYPLQVGIILLCTRTPHQTFHQHQTVHMIVTFVRSQKEHDRSFHEW